jgi:CheY-like chemotaxis protein
VSKKEESKGKLIPSQQTAFTHAGATLVTRGLNDLLKATVERPRVLVVDDEHVIADTLTIILNQAGFNVSAAYDGLNAVELARSIRPDAVISDFNHPGINGIETAIRIREFLPTCKVLLLSGMAASADLLQYARAQGCAFEIIAKPTSPHSLLHWLRVGGEHDVHSCRWCQEQRALLGVAYPHGTANDECQCSWCLGLRTGDQPSSPNNSRT